jgi:peptidyl-prolyl cis-trans isomerase D
MFDLFRSRDKAVRYLLGALLGLVALSMVVTLIPGYGTPSSAPEQILAEIGDDRVTVTDVQRQIQNLTRSRNVPPEMLQFYVPQIIDQMIAERAIAYQAERMGFRVTEEDVRRAILSMTAQLFPTGEFDKDTYQRYLAQQGMTIPEFERNVRLNLLLVQMQNLVLEGIIVTPEEIAREYHRTNDKIKLEYVAYTVPDLRSQVSTTPQELQQYFEVHKNALMTPEKRSFDVLIADEEKIGAAVQVNEQELRTAYSRNLERYRTPERVRVRHVLIKTQGKSPEETKKAEATANDLVKQIKGGADFAEIAKKHSEDPGSAAKGGDLDWVTRGQMVPAFEAAAFSLKPNEISNLIKTEYGYHIVQVLEKETARVKPFEEVRAELEMEAKREAVYQKMQTAIDQARAELARNPKQAEQIAAKYNLMYVKADNVGRGQSIPEIGTNAELEATVSELRAGEVSPVVQITPTRLAVAVVNNIVPPRVPQLAEIESDVREKLSAQKAQQLAQQRTKEMQDKFAAAGGDLNAIAKANGLEVKQTQFFGQDGAADGIGPAQYVVEGFNKPAGSVLPPFTIGNQVFLAKVIDKQVANPSSMSPAEREQLVVSLKRKKAAERRELFEDGLLTQLIKEGKVKKYAENIKRVTANYQG